MRGTAKRLAALGLVFAAGLFLTFVPAAPRAHADNVCTPDSSWGTVNGSYASQVISLVNQHRASLGLGQLAVDSALSRSAVWKSMNMAGLNYFDHTDDPIGRSVGQRLSDCGWPSNLGWGENIAYGYSTPADVMNGWLNSAGHKANIENPSFTTIGVGVAANSQGVYYWTQDFGAGSSGGSPPPPTTTTAPPPTTTTPPPPVTTTPPATTSRSTTTAPTTTSPAPPTTTTAPETSTTIAVPKRTPTNTKAPTLHKHAKAKKTKKAKKRSTGIEFVVHGFLDLHQLRHL